jgi:large subunit ribosomal protein L25
MLEQLEMEVTTREERGKNAARRLRASGRVPATLYGMGQEPLSLALDNKAIVGMLSQRNQRNRVLQLKGGASGAAMAIAWQVDPVENSLLHVDLKRIDVNAPVTANVAVRTKGVAYGVKTEGGMEEVILHEAHVRCLPADLPEAIEIDVTELKAGQSIRLGDLATDGKYEILGDPAAVVVRIVIKKAEPKPEEEAAAAAAAAPAAPAEE